MADRDRKFSFFQRIDKRIDIPISIRPMIANFGKQVRLQQDLIQMRLIKQMLVTSLRLDRVTNLKHISTTRVPIATKLGRMATYLYGLLPIKSHDPLITWFCKIT